jgi:type 1 glutamine amidotransferase
VTFGTSIAHKTIPFAALCLLGVAATAPAQISTYNGVPAPPTVNTIPRPQSIDANKVQIQTPQFEDVIAMQDALPVKAIVPPKKPRKLLVLAKAAGFVHSSIPLAAYTVRDMGDRTGAWSTIITYDPADINTENLKQYDAIFLASTTGQFLDDKGDPAATEARRKALLDFVRGGKGLAGIHAAGDSYHTKSPNGPQQIGTWPEFDKMIGGYFKFHWGYPTLITVKIDDPKSPLTAMFHGKEFDVHDEVYTFAQDSFSRKNVHVLTSVDYSKMPDAIKAKEPAETKRTDGDYALSWIHRDGQGRVFYEALGHTERFYANPLLLEHLLAGIQYALGDLKANDAPDEK